MTDLYAKRRSELPSSYVLFIEAHGSWEGDLGEELGYVVLWDRRTIQEQYEANEMSQRLSDIGFRLARTVAAKCSVLT
jgi:hypothetical protein